MKIVIVGGVAAGASAATKARRNNEEAEIIVLEKGSYVSFANCGLPYYVGGTIPKREHLLLVTPALFKKRFNIDVRVEHEVIDINPTDKKVIIKHQDTIITEDYDKLILAVGNAPVLPPVPGRDLPQVYQVFTVNDVDAITGVLASGAKSAVIMGGGFIGLETAEALLGKGIKTSLIVKQNQLMAKYDPEFSLPLELHLQEMGLEIYFESKVQKIEGEERVEGVLLEDGTRIEADLVIMAVGSRPRLELARKAGLMIGEAGGVAVDASMLTSDPHIYAAGDMVESVHLVSGKKAAIPLAGSANKQGRIAGANAVGGRMLFKGVLGTAIIKVGELTLAKTGLTEREAASLGLKYYVSYNPANSNATYYPGSTPLILKLVIEEDTGRILGAQCVGQKGVDKRIDVISTAIYANLNIQDLEHLDLAYAPPYGSARDPVIMAGMVASNILRGEVRHITPGQLKSLKDTEDIQLVDVRTRSEHRACAIEGAVLLPLDELRQRYQELDLGKKTVVYCAVGYRSYIAYRFLRQKGYNVFNLSGGYSAYAMKI